MSRKVGLVWDAAFLAHDAGQWHPERPERLISIREHLQNHDCWTRLQILQPRKALTSELLRCHALPHIEAVLAADGKAHTVFDGDTQASAGTTQAALLASGGGIDLVERVLNGELDNGFALVRPPGHHAEYDRAMGFCYFNNIAVAARAALTHPQVQRILIVDWDVHHGNGTQHSFEEDPNVMFVSLHQFPHYPGTGDSHELGIGPGLGANINVPLLSGAGDHEFRFFFQKLIAPVARQFQPDLIMISAGYDAHVLDPLGGLKVSTAGFAALALDLHSLALELCDGKIVAFLEGGYDLEGVGAGATSTIRTFLGDELDCRGEPELANSSALDLFDELKQSLAPYWSLD